MILFKYTKCDGCEYVPHLDMLRHITRTLVRAKIKVNRSEGFNKHPKIYMSSPLGVGIKSLAEYCTVDTAEDITTEDFKIRFNANAPKGLECVGCCYTQTNVNVASLIYACDYKLSPMPAVDIDSILAKNEFFVADKKGNMINVRDRILSLSYDGNDFFCQLKTGNENLRPDVFVRAICTEFGGEIIKLKAYGLEQLNIV